MKRLIVTLLILMSSLMGATTQASAESLSIHGLTITPDLSQVVLQPDQDSVTYQISLDNNLSVPISVSISSLDFKSLNDSGGLLFIGSGASDLQHKYGLAHWISLPDSPITLAPGGGQLVPITIQNRANLSPGGHYAAIIFHVNNDSSSGKNNVQLNQEVSSLVFLRKLGGETYGLNITKAHHSGNLFSWPNKLDLTFSNTGNTQAAPVGYVDLLGQRSLLNENSNLVLPENSRTLSVNLNASPGFWPQRYHIAVHYRPDAVNGFKVYNLSFWYINPFFLLLLAVAFTIASYRVTQLRKAWIWLGLKVDRLVRHLEVWVPKALRAIKKSLVWTGLKLDRQLRRLELALTKQKSSKAKKKK